MIEGIVGLMGQGKTYLATELALNAIAAGRPVIANYNIKGAAYARDWQELTEFREGLVVIDEANIWCPSRFWNKLDPRILYYWSQSRKLGLDIIWTAQHEARVDTALREITYRIWKSRRIGRVFRYTAFVPEEIRKKDRFKMGAKWRWRRQAIMDAYDTLQLVDLGSQLLDRDPDGIVYRDSAPAAVPVEVQIQQPVPKRTLRRHIQRGGL